MRVFPPRCPVERGDCGGYCDSGPAETYRGLQSVAVGLACENGVND